jgi:vancomycin resistance protein YoaR
MTATTDPTTNPTTDPTTAPTTTLATPQSVQAPQFSGNRPTRRMSRREVLGWAALGGFAALLAPAALATSPVYARQYNGRVFPGVGVAGVSLDGLTREEATARLNNEALRYAAQPLQFVAPQGGHSWSVAPKEFGLRFDYATAVEQALAVHRGNSRWDRFIGGFEALLPGNRAASLTLPAALDDTLLTERLRAWADTATTPPTDASFTTANGQLAIAPDKAGLGIAPDATRDAILDRASRLAPGPVTLAMVPVPATVTAARLGELLPQAQAIVAQPLALEHDGQRWDLGTELLRAALGYRRDGDRLTLTVDTDFFRPTLRAMAGQVAAPPHDARIVQGGDGRFSIDPDRAGAVLDEPGTLAGIERALLAIAPGQGAAPAVALLMKPQAPAVTAADLDSTFKRLDAMLNTPVVVAYEEYNFTLQRGDILPLLVVTDAPNSPEKVQITVDQARAEVLVRDLADGINKEPRDAQFRWLDGAVKATVPSEDGRNVEITPTAQALATAILGATGTLTPVVTAVKPKVDNSAAAGIVIGDRLSYGDTDYSYSIASRKHNVELSLERLNGALVPPDGLFSFNETVGAQTIENGYQAAYGIAMVGTGQPQTVSSVGGGICQVATTLFQPIYHIGVPVEERNWHLYWIPNYGLPPSGLKGLDATVDDQSKVDFKFRNTTGNWLAIEAVPKNGRVYIAVHGQDPGWQIQIDDPVITNPRPADTTPVTEKTHDLPPGQTLLVEHAEDGFDAANHIVVRDSAGNVLRDVTFRSSYLPSRNVTQVGVPASEPVP